MGTEGTASDLLKRRDVGNFMVLRNAHPGDDGVIGKLLVRSFRETYALKLPFISNSEAREDELRDVQSRRKAGCVRVLELGYEIIGTFSLISQETKSADVWFPNAVSLRCLALEPKFQSLRLSDALLVDAIGMARSWRADHICLHVQLGAVGVGQLYERHGFIRCPKGDRIANGYAIQGYRLALGSSFSEQSQ